jgi:hypothetical protein
MHGVFRVASVVPVLRVYLILIPRGLSRVTCVRAVYIRIRPSIHARSYHHISYPRRTVV